MDDKMMVDVDFLRWKLVVAEANLKKAQKNVIKYNGKVKMINTQLKAAEENNKKTTGGN